MLKNTFPHLEKLTLSKADSESVNLLKVLLIILVVFIHVLPGLQPIPQDCTDPLFLFRSVSELITYNLGRIAVPGFFLISGYFFFFQKELTIESYKLSLLKRVMSLLIPYVLWNVFYYSLILGKVSLSVRFGIDVYPDELAKINTPFYQHLLEPINYPLWYVRDLMCMALISPIIYYGVKWLKAYFIALLYLNYLFGWGCIGFSQEALFYFSLGVYLCLKRVNIVRASKEKMTIILLLPSVILMFLSFPYSHAPYSEYLIKLYIPLLLPLFLRLSSYLSSKMRVVWVGGVQYLGRYVFFIYAMHVVFVLNLVRAFYVRVGFPLESLYNYFLTGFTTILVCIILYELADRVLPKKVMSLMTGGR